MAGGVRGSKLSVYDPLSVRLGRRRTERRRQWHQEDADGCRVCTPVGTLGDDLRISWNLAQKDPGDAGPAE